MQWDKDTLKTARVNAKLSQTALAKGLCVHWRTVQNWEKGLPIPASIIPALDKFFGDDKNYVLISEYNKVVSALNSATELNRKLIEIIKKNTSDLGSFDKEVSFLIDQSQEQKLIKVGTLFSGIGAFEEALLQLNIPHEIKFACDNGEIEFVPFDDQKTRKEFKELERSVRSLNEEQKQRLAFLQNEISNTIEMLRDKCYSMPNNAERTKFINQLYVKYSPFKNHNFVKDAYLANYDLPEEEFHTDVRFMKGDEYAGQIDIMVGGSPCQSFSTYGKKRGLEDTRGTLFYDYARIIGECRPKVFIYENVNGLLSHDDGKTWEVMKEVWESLGYVLNYQILNAADYNFPQIRHRLFLVGIRGDLYKQPYRFPEKLELTHKSTEYLETDVPNSFYLPKKGFEWVTTHNKNDNRTRFNRDVIGAQTATQQDNWTGDLRVEPALQRHYDDPRVFVGKFDFGNGPIDAVARKMTPRECMNLMGFDKNFKIVVPKTVAYRHAGNSIVVPVLKEIIKSLYPYIY